MGVRQERARAHHLHLHAGQDLRPEAQGAAGSDDPLRWCAATLADDLAYGAGVWRGTLRERTALPLLPAFTDPTRGRGPGGDRGGRVAGGRPGGPP
ncbi:hypothetical protein ABZZ79_35320 [Streptomyces sp. NPDC006458]|uniref:hypothetical protein n=1 Tax=Streptomyces sp. NPDC006458 TaxID=3154302 RepID=UPI0033A60BF5